MRKRGMRSGERSNVLASACCLVVLAIFVGACGSKYTYEELAASQGTIPAGPTTTLAAGAEGSDATIASGQPDPAVGGTTGGDSGGTITGGAIPSPQGGDSPATAAAASCTGTKSPIKLGAVGTQSGLIGAVQKSQVIMVQAWAASVNARGGIGCHPIKYVVADDGGDPSKHLSLVRRLVEQDGVIAFLQMDAVLTGQASVDYLNEKGIPVLGSSGGDNWFYTSPVHFTPNATGDPYLASAAIMGMEMAKAAGVDQIGTFGCIEASICSRLNTIADDIPARYGVRVGYRGTGSITQPDFTSSCLGAQRAGIKVLVIAMDANSLQRFARSCATVGFRPTVIAAGIALTPTLPSDPNVADWYGALSTVPFNSGHPLAVEQREVLQRYASGQGASPGTMQGYLAAKLFERAMADPPEDPTSVDVLARIRAIKGTDMDGTTNQLDFSVPEPKAFCGWLVQIKDEKYVSSGDEPRVCGQL